MKKVTLNIEVIKQGLKLLRFNQKQLSQKIEVSEQAVSYWLNGDKLPETENLQKLASTLNLAVKDLITFSAEPLPQFKLPKTTKRKDSHLDVANSMTHCLKKMMPIIRNNYLSNPLSLKDPKLDYEYIQLAAHSIRNKLNSKNEIVEINNIIEFISKELNTIIVPVIWGVKKHFAEALIIPCENIYFLYINLDSYNRDNKFWLLHEMCHIIAPTIQNSYDIAEQFSNSLSNAILFPEELSELTYFKLMKIEDNIKKIKLMKEMSTKYSVNLYTVFKSTDEFLKNKSIDSSSILPNLEQYFKNEIIKSDNECLSMINVNKFVNDYQYEFKTKFYNYLKLYYENNPDEGALFIRKLLHISLNDAIAIYRDYING